MTQLRTRPTPTYPPTYNGYQIVRSRGRLFAVPPFLDVDDTIRRGAWTSHPAILSAATRADLETQIDSASIGRVQPEVVGECKDYDIVRYRGNFFGVPKIAKQVDLDLHETRQLAGVIRARSALELRERICNLRESVPVEFAGWLPVFEVYGNCGRHPQFEHTSQPPAGYRFVCSAPGKKVVTPLWDRLLQLVTRMLAAVWMAARPLVSLFSFNTGIPFRDRVRVFGAFIRLMFSLLRSGAPLGAAMRFVRSRNYHSQFLLAKHRGLVFLTSMPYTYGQNPW
jgi:hypothetical protein